MTFIIEKLSEDGLTRQAWSFVLGEWRGGGLLLSSYSVECRASRRHKWRRSNASKSYNRMDNRHYNGNGLPQSEVPRLTDQEVMGAAKDAIAKYPVVWPEEQK